MTSKTRILGRSIEAYGPSLQAQVLASARNLLFAVVAANALGGAGFGRLAVVLTVSFGANEVVRALVFHPLAIVEHDDPDAALRGALVRAGLLSGGVALVVAGLAAVLGLPIEYVVGAAVYPAGAVADGMRVGSLNIARDRDAVAMEARWLLALVSATAVASWVSDDAVAFVAAWGAAAAAVGVWWVVTRAHGPVDRVQRWRLGVPLAAQVLVETVPMRVLPVALAVAISDEKAGGIRGAEVLLGAATVIWSAVALKALPRARAVAQSGEQRSVVASVATPMAGVLLVVAASVTVARLLPPAVGSRLLGETFDAAQDVVVPVGLLLASFVMLSVVTISWRAQHELTAAGLAVGAAAVTSSAAMVVGSAADRFDDGLVFGAVGIMVVAAVAFTMQLRASHARDHDAQDHPRH